MRCVRARPRAIYGKRRDRTSSPSSPALGDGDVLRSLVFSFFFSASCRRDIVVVVDIERPMKARTLPESSRGPPSLSGAIRAYPPRPEGEIQLGEKSRLVPANKRRRRTWPTRSIIRRCYAGYLAGEVNLAAVSISEHRFGLLRASIIYHRDRFISRSERERKKESKKERERESECERSFERRIEKLERAPPSDARCSIYIQSDRDRASSP